MSPWAMATKVQKSRARCSCFPSCFQIPSVFSEQKKNKKKKKSHAQIDPRVSPKPEASKDRPEKQARIWMKSSWFKPMKYGWKQPPKLNPRIAQKLGWHEVGRKVAERAITSTADQKIAASSNGIVEDTSGHQSRPEATILPTKTTAGDGDSSADQSQQKANFRPKRSESQETIAIREVQEVTEAPESQVRETRSRDPATTSSENNSSFEKTSARNKQKPAKCLLSSDFSRNRIERARKKSDYELGPMVGMSIVLVSLTSLLLCGRLCSIFWTSACLCLVPRLRRRETTHRADAEMDGQAQLDMDSDEYKKKVIMEGMLKRNHKN
ncbi:Uncharacterized protein EJ110_NYTH48414 [Nymphaea thermarum]|nr:Uncharacterized protein EJ110_NYTH48414 [Nymphaea thermarum]